ncbi:universal stress protein [Hyalangium rubrum]|uniref:Universal stress protein n=1 Tax=Hyalangium rubrum TaxID=3103134 RepID=A0ABU5HH83_9BACT|nr:universal stress protein [Hyalangium sp. s54d21]MDY7232818.1 universal stress protein [Hyalangium sp. s54d21]
MFRSLLIPIDLSTASSKVIGRAALLPLAEGAHLTLLHVVPQGLPRAARLSAEGDAQKALAAAAKRVAHLVPKGVVVKQLVKVGSAAAQIARQAHAVRADLIVMGRGGGRALRELFLGSTAERVIRKGQLPVLVVRQPARAPYHRPLLALDTDPVAHDVLALALRALAPSARQIDLVHAYDLPHQGLIYPSLSPNQGQGYRNHYRQKALHDVAQLVATALAELKPSPDDVPSFKTHVRYGSPRTLIPETVAALRTDLLVLGTHGYEGVAHALLGTVAGDVLREVPCDVMVVPPSASTARKK